MSQWNIVKNQADIEGLLGAYGGFHDSCIVALNYVSGAHVDDSLAMGFGAPNDYRLCVKFQRQFRPKTIELCFSGLHRMNIIGWQDNYFCEITGCYLSFRKDLIEGATVDLIVWADYEGFDAKNVGDGALIDEPMTSFIIADELTWRFLDDNNNVG